MLCNLCASPFDIFLAPFANTQSEAIVVYSVDVFVFVRVCVFVPSSRSSAISLLGFVCVCVVEYVRRI